MHLSWEREGRWRWCLRRLIHAAVGGGVGVFVLTNIDHVRMYAGVQIVNLDDEGRRFGCPGYESGDVISPIHR